MKEKLVELVVDQAADLGIKLIALAGNSLVKLAEDLTEARIDRELNRNKISSLRERMERAESTITAN